MLVWGRDTLWSNPDGLFGHSTVDMMKRGMKVIVVDPRANWLARHAEIHFQIRPGTDAALAMALNTVIIEEDLYDHEFVEKWTYGFNEYAERCRTMTPEMAAEICEVPVEDIYKAARCLAQKPCTASVGLKTDQNPNTLQICHAIWGIFAICGNLDNPGGIKLGQTMLNGGLDGTQGRGHAGPGRGHQPHPHRRPRPVPGHGLHHQHDAARLHAGHAAHQHPVPHRVFVHPETRTSSRRASRSSRCSGWRPAATRSSWWPPTSS